MYPLGWLGHMIHRWIELSKSFRMDLYLLYKFFDLKKLMTSDTPLEREWKELLNGPISSVENIWHEKVISVWLWGRCLGVGVECFRLRFRVRFGVTGLKVYPVEWLGHIIHYSKELLKSFWMDLYLLYKFFDLTKIYPWVSVRVRFGVRVKRCTHLG